MRGIKQQLKDGLCPCCEQPWHPKRPKVDLNLNVFSYDHWRMPVSAVEAEILFALSERYPEPVTTERLIQKVWGDASTEWALKNLHGRICVLRRKMRAVPMRIVMPGRNAYRLQNPLA